MPKPSSKPIGIDQIAKDRLDQILEDRVAKRRFNQLIKRGATLEVLAKWLTLVPQMDTKKGPLVPGFDDRTVKKLPETTEAMARTLQQVNHGRVSPAEVLPRMFPIEYLTADETFAARKLHQQLGQGGNPWPKGGSFPGPAAVPAGLCDLSSVLSRVGRT